MKIMLSPIVEATNLDTTTDANSTSRQMPSNTPLLVTKDSSAAQNQKLENNTPLLSDLQCYSLIQQKDISKENSSENVHTGVCALLPLSDCSTEPCNKLLQKVEESFSDGNILISMLQGQLKKIETSYKQSLDDTQALRLKYCLTTLELSNIKRICEKYKEDIHILIEQKEAIESNVQILQKDINQWKIQYETLSQEIKVKTTKTISREVQVKIEQIYLKDDVEILKNHCCSIQSSLHIQNKKLELLVEKFQGDVIQLDNDSSVKYEVEKLSTENVWMENQELKKQLENLKIQNSKLLCSKTELSMESDDKDCKTIDDLVNQLKLPQEDIEKLQSQVDQSSIKKDYEYYSSLSAGPYINNHDFQDLLIENSNLKNELHIYKCFIKTTPTYIDSDYTQSSDSDCCCILSSTESSKINFFTNNKQLIASSGLKQCPEDSKNINDKTKAELICLCGELHQKDSIIKNLQKQGLENVEDKDAIINDLRHKYDLLKDNFEKLPKSTFNSFNQTARTDEKAVNCNLQTKSNISEENNKKTQSLQICMHTLLEQELSNRSKNRVEKETNTVKEYLEQEMNTLANSKTEIQTLEVKIGELKMLNAKLNNENEIYSNKLTDFDTKLKKTHNELAEAKITNTKLKEDNEALILQLKDAKNTLEQYKEMTLFKTLENNKLRQKEEELCSCLLTVRKSKENVVNERNKDKEHADKIVSKVTEDYKNSKIEYENRLKKLNEENTHLLKSIQEREKEINTLQDKMKKVAEELQNEKYHRNQDSSLHEKSLSEFKMLVQNKKDELIEMAKNLHMQKEYLINIEKENGVLKDLLNDKRNSLLAQEKFLKEILQKYSKETNSKPLLNDLSKHIEDLNVLQQIYKNKNVQFKNISQKVNLDLKNQKLLLKNLINNLKEKTQQLEISKKNDKDSLIVLKDNIDEIFQCLQAINSIILQCDVESKEPSNDESEMYSCYYNEEESECKYSNNCLPKCHPGTPEELQIKRKLMVDKVKCMEERLNVLKSNLTMHKHSIPIKTTSSSESDLTCLKNSDKKQLSLKHLHFDQFDISNFLFKCRFYLDRIALIDHRLHNQPKNTANNLELEDDGTSYKANLKIIQKIGLGLNKVKTWLKYKEDLLNTECNQVVLEKNMQQSYRSVQNQIKSIQQQIKDTSLMSEQTEDMEFKLKSQYIRLQKLEDKAKAKIQNVQCCTGLWLTPKEKLEGFITSAEKTPPLKDGSLNIPEKLMKYKNVTDKNLCQKYRGSISKVTKTRRKYKEILSKHRLTPIKSIETLLPEITILKVPGNTEKLYHNKNSSNVIMQVTKMK